MSTPETADIPTVGASRPSRNLYSARRGRFYDTWESLPDGRRRAVISERLRDCVAWAKRLPFYRGRLASFDPRAEHPLAESPPLKSEELRNLLPPVSRKLLTVPDGDYTVFQSGGTTGFPKTTLFSSAELDALDLPNARGFFACGLEPSDRVANLFAVGGLYMTFIHINRMLQQYGCANFPFSNHTPPDFIHAVAKLFKINCVAGISSVTLNALRGLKAIGLDGIKIEKLYYGGEHLYEADKREIREAFGTKTILAPGYGTVDSWYIGYQCRESDTGVFHLHDDQCYMEIVDEETRKPCAPGAVGMLYATGFPRRLTPIVRYRVGDRAQWLGERCSCGRSTPVFRLLGRGDDVLRIGYDSVDYNFIQQAAAGLRGLSGTIQMQKLREYGKDRLVVRVETDAPKAKHSDLSKVLAQAISHGRPTLRLLVSEGKVSPVRVELLGLGRIPRNPRTGKLVRVIDSL